MQYKKSIPVLFVILYKVVLTFESGDEDLFESLNIQKKTFEHSACLWCYLLSCKICMLKCNHLIESYFPFLSFSTLRF